ncbi:glycoside hydrolase 5 family protein [Dokdonia pacifica]|uniref:Cellulase (Glycosyl hydrolase family 5) n=1 Tax=Dokdonia pacifica TaxID=1627892 RepID=A0A238VTU5_9FLAO|nr:hypothetical protein [Dokdonia pacifica]SNR37574.1 hypothetical protein SAMN06265376_101338 [Dokdonia pacifica]
MKYPKHLQPPHDIDFVHGINIAWLDFGKDVGIHPITQEEYHPDWDTLDEIMELTVANGGNVIRWWYHTDGSTNPRLDDTKKALPNPDFFHQDVMQLLAMAASKGLKIQICLWSFDMLKTKEGVDAQANKKLLTEVAHYTAYIENALLPLVNYIGAHPGLFAWEIFNEPEGMTHEYASHWEGFAERVTMEDIQRFINRTAAYIRNAQPDVKITSGALGFLSSIDDPKHGYQNRYSDQVLEDIGGEITGYLDFYNIHYYTWAKKEGSPFHTRYDAKKLDKRAIIAEYYPDPIFEIPSENLVNTLKHHGWHGSIVWSWTDKSWELIEKVLQGGSDTDIT